MSSDTKQLLEDCTYANGCIPGTDCEGCAVEVTIMMVVMVIVMVMMMVMIVVMMMVMNLIMIIKVDHDGELNND